MLTYIDRFETHQVLDWIDEEKNWCFLKVAGAAIACEI